MTPIIRLTILLLVTLLSLAGNSDNQSRRTNSEPKTSSESSLFCDKPAEVSCKNLPNLNPYLLDKIEEIKYRALSNTALTFGKDTLSEEQLDGDSHGLGSNIYKARDTYRRYISDSLKSERNKLQPDFDKTVNITKQLLKRILAKLMKNDAKKDALLKAVDRTKFLMAGDMDLTSDEYNNIFRYLINGCGINGLSVNATAFKNEQIDNTILVCEGTVLLLGAYPPNQREDVLVWLLGHELGHIVDFEGMGPSKWTYLACLEAELKSESANVQLSQQVQPAAKETWADYLGTLVLSEYLAEKQLNDITHDIQEVATRTMRPLCELMKSYDGSGVYGYLPYDFRIKNILAQDSIATKLSCSRKSVCSRL